MNLVSADAMMIADAVFWGVRLVGFVAMIVTSVSMLLWLLGWAAVCAVVLLFALVALQSLIGKLQGGQQRQKQAHADARIQQVLEAVMGVAVLKQQVDCSKPTDSSSRAISAHKFVILAVDSDFGDRCGKIIGCLK